MKIEVKNYQFKNLALCEQAFRHRSSTSRAEESNERLELLGDAVLELALTDYLYRISPQLSEGSMSKRRASLVNSQSLNELAYELGFEAFVKTGKGEIENWSRVGFRFMASVFEAVIGAIYLDSDFQTAKTWIEGVFHEKLNSLSMDGDFQSDFKSRLQEIIQKEIQGLPRYELVKEEGPAHAKEFEIEVFVRDEKLGMGRGRSKKVAEQVAAQAALLELERKGKI